MEGMGAAVLEVFSRGSFSCFMRCWQTDDAFL